MSVGALKIEFGLEIETRRTCVKLVCRQRKVCLDIKYLTNLKNDELPLAQTSE